MIEVAKGELCKMENVQSNVPLNSNERTLTVMTKLQETNDVAKEFRVLMQIYEAGIQTVKTRLQTLDAEFHAKYDYNPIHHIESRLKEPQSIFEKLQRMGVPMTMDGMQRCLTDIAGVRVICNYVNDAENIAELLLRQDDVELVKKTDYIRQPKENGYRSLHIVITVPVFLSDHTRRVPVEVQIRTIAMDCWASLEHHLGYKSAGVIPEDLRYRLKICAMAIAEVDAEMQQIKEEIESLYLG